MASKKPNPHEQDIYMTPESLVLTINLTIALVAYLIIHPRTAGADLHKLTVSDLGATMASVLVCGRLFWDSGVEFSVLFTTINWFWFAVLSYFVIELPFALWYMKRYGLRFQD